MKKLITLSFFAFFTVSVFAQLTIQMHDINGPIADGATITINSDITQPMITSLLFLENTGSSDLDMMCQRYDQSVVVGSHAAFCFGTCYPPSVMISPTPRTILSGVIDSLAFAADFTHGGRSGFSVIKYTFFDNSNPNDSISVTFEYDISVGINEGDLANNKMGNIYPNPATNSTNVDFYISASNKNTNLIIRDLLGKEIQNILIDSREESSIALNTSNLQSGIYFISIVADNSIIGTKKLIVK